jgi:hypothetical protein
LTSVVGATSVVKNNNLKEGVYFFRNTGYQINSLSVSASKNYARLSNNLNDKISSIYIKGNYVVEVYSDSSFKGTKKIFTSSISNLNNVKLNDKISSIKVIKKENTSNVKGAVGIFNLSNAQYISAVTARGGAITLYRKAGYTGVHNIDINTLNKAEFQTIINKDNTVSFSTNQGINTYLKVKENGLLETSPDKEITGANKFKLIKNGNGFSLLSVLNNKYVHLRTDIPSLVLYGVSYLKADESRYKTAMIFPIYSNKLPIQNPVLPKEEIISFSGRYVENYIGFYWQTSHDSNVNYVEYRHEDDAKYTRVNDENPEPYRHNVMIRSVSKTGVYFYRMTSGNVTTQEKSFVITKLANY